MSAASNAHYDDEIEDDPVEAELRQVLVLAFGTHAALRGLE
jgi:hypothetical protein